MQTEKAVMAVFAHADDVELGCGGTLSKYREKSGYRVDYVMSTNNMSGSWCSLTPDGKLESRKRIAKVNGIKDYRDTGTQNVEMLRLLHEGKLIKEIGKKTVYVEKYRSRKRLSTPVDQYRTRKRDVVPVSYTYSRELREPIMKEVTGNITLVAD